MKHDGPAAVEHVKTLTKELRAAKSEVLEGVRRVFQFPGAKKSGEGWRYPTFGWFKENPRVPLEEFNDRVAKER